MSIDPMARLLHNRLRKAESIIELAEKTFLDTACLEDVNSLLDAIKKYKKPTDYKSREDLIGKVVSVAQELAPLVEKMVDSYQRRCLNSDSTYAIERHEHAFFVCGEAFLERWQGMTNTLRTLASLDALESTHDRQESLPPADISDLVDEAIDGLKSIRPWLSNDESDHAR